MSIYKYKLALECMKFLVVYLDKDIVCYDYLADHKVMPGNHIGDDDLPT